jgi:transposase-like protein
MSASGRVSVKPKIETGQPRGPVDRVAPLPARITDRSIIHQLRETLALEARQLSEKARILDRTGVDQATRKRSGNTEANEEGPRGKTRTIAVASAILENYRSGKASLEELVLELYHAELSIKTVDEITTRLWGMPLNSEAIAELSRQVTATIDVWLKRPLARCYAKLFAEGTLLRWRAHHRECCVPVLVAMAVNAAGYREIVAVVPGSRDESADFRTLFRSLRERGLKGADLFVGDHLSGFGPGLIQVFPNAVLQNCATRLREKALALATPDGRTVVDHLLVKIHECADGDAASEIASRGVIELEKMGQHDAAGFLREEIEPTLTCFTYAESERPFLASNAILIRSLREIRERARQVGAFSDEASAVTLVAARLRHRMRATWGRYRCGRMAGARSAMRRSSILA